MLEKPIENINKNTKYNVSYEVIKTGRKVAGFKFYCNCNKTVSDEDYTETIDAAETAETTEIKLENATGQTRLLEPPPQTPRGLNDKKQEAYDWLINRGVGAKKAEEITKKYDYDRIICNLRKAVEQKDTAKNLAGLIISFIENDVAGQDVIAKKEAKEREAKRQLDYRQAYDACHGTTLLKIGTAEAEKDEEKAENQVLELTDLEVDMIKDKGDKAGPFLLKMKKLGLTIEDVKAGKRRK